MRKLAATAALGLLGGALALAGPASADHNIPDVSLPEQPGECGEMTFHTSWSTETHKVTNTLLVVRIGGEVTTSPILTPLTVGPFDAEAVLIEWRVWGGGERNYDRPPLTDLDALLDHIGQGGDPLAADAPGVAWHSRTVKGCPPKTEPTPTPTMEPTTEPTMGPTTEPTEKPDDGEGGEADGDDDKKLPVTGLSTGVMAGGALALLAAGAGLYLAARRRGASFTS